MMTRTMTIFGGPRRKHGFRARFVILALLADAMCSSALLAVGGPARLARLAGVERADSGVEPARAVNHVPPPPRGFGPGILAQGMTYAEVARCLGDEGERVPPAPRWTGAAIPGEVTYRWPFADGSDVTAAFKDGKVVWFVLFSVKGRG
jgi:hypothetical protein